MSTEQNPALPPQSARAGIEQFTDFDDLAAFYTGWNVGVEQYSAGAFSGAVRLVRTSTMYVVDGQFSQALTVRGSSNPTETAFYLIDAASADSIWWGRRLNPGHVVAIGPDTAADYHSSRNTRTVGIAVPNDLLTRAVSSLSGSDPQTCRVVERLQRSQICVTQA